MLSEDDKWFAVCLRFMGDGFNPREIEKLLELRPSSIRVAGETWTGKSGRVYGPATRNVWCFSVEAPDAVGFEERIQLLLDAIRPNRDALCILTATANLEAEVFCGFGSGNGQGGDTISAASLGELASLGLGLSLDLYPPDIDERPLVHRPSNWCAYAFDGTW